MKAERRQDLKTNSLARSIQNLPELWRLHGNKVFLVVIAILLAIIVVRYRLADSAQRLREARESLTEAESKISQLRTSPFWNFEPETIGGVRNQFAGDAEDAISEALKKSDDPAVKARAYVDRGDLNFLLANFAPPPPHHPARDQPDSDA